MLLTIFFKVLYTDPDGIAFFVVRIFFEAAAGTRVGEGAGAGAGTGAGADADAGAAAWAVADIFYDDLLELCFRRTALGKTVRARQ